MTTSSSVIPPFSNGGFRGVFSPDFRRKYDLLFLLTKKEFALKYKRTILGIFWSLLNPILTAAVFFVAFKIFMRYKMENYSFFLLSALFPWSWFSSSIIISARSLVDNVTLIKKVIFPRQYLVFSVIIAQLVNLVFSIPILLFFSMFSARGPSWNWCLGIPLLIIVQAALTFGLALIISISNTYFRDIEYLVGVLMNLLFWVTPIAYQMKSIPERYRAYVLLNPLATLMDGWRELFLNNTIVWQDLGVSYCMALAIFLAGKTAFRRMERTLDEVL